MVLYVLCLVQDLAPELRGGVALYVAAQQVVAGYEHLVAALAADAGALRRRAHHGHHVHLGRELLELRHPVVDQGGRAHHEARAPAAVCQQEGYHLHGLAQAHLVREDAAKAHGRKRAEPLEAGALVRAQLARDRGGRLEALGVHGAESVHVRAERLVLLLVRHDVVEQERLVAGNAHLAGRKVARGQAKLLREGGRLRKVRAGKVHERSVAQPVEALVAAVAGKQAKQLVQRQVVRGDPQVDEVRPHGEPHLHPWRLAAQHPVERVRHVDGARLAKAGHAVQKQPRDGGGVLLAYGRHRATRGRQPEVLLHQLARPGLPRGVARVVRHGVGVAREHGEPAGAVAGLRAARHARARVVQVEVQREGLRHLVQHLLRRVHAHGLAHAGQHRGRKARHVALAQEHPGRVARIHARKERRHVQQPLGAAEERVARQRIQVARRREELCLALALQVERAIARLLKPQAHLGVAVRDGHVARRLLHALRHHLDLDRAANVQRYELVQLRRREPQLAANGRLQPRHAIHARRHARRREGAPVLHGAHQKLRHGARLCVEHVERVHERELLAVLVKRARHDVLRKVAHVAHHVRAARPRYPQAQVPVVLVLERHLEAHGPGRRVRRGGHAHRGRRARAVQVVAQHARGSRLALRAVALVRARVAVEVQRQRDAVLARPRVAPRRRAGAVVVHHLVRGLVNGDAAAVVVLVSARAVDARLDADARAAVAAGAVPYAVAALRYDAPTPQHRRPADLGQRLLGYQATTSCPSFLRDATPAPHGDPAGEKNVFPSLVPYRKPFVPAIAKTGASRIFLA